MERRRQEAELAARDAGQHGIIVAGASYGQGSSREHAAMEPRHMGCRAVIVRSFARIHETNLKKQGILPLTFRDPADYKKVQEDDKVDILGLAGLAPGQPVTMVLHHVGGGSDEIVLDHTMTDEQISWFRAGSALNKIKVKRTKSFWLDNVMLVEATPDVIQRLAELPEVIEVFENFTLTLPPRGGSEGRPLDGQSQAMLWDSMEKIGARQVWNTYGFDGTGVVIGGLDTGVDLGQLPGRVQADDRHVEVSAIPLEPGDEMLAV